MNGASLEATLLQLPSATSLEMGPVDDSELTSIEIDGQTLFWTRVDGQRESITVDAVVEGDLNDFFIIPAVTQASISENQSIESNQTIWVDGVSSESIAFTMTQ